MDGKEWELAKVEPLVHGVHNIFNISFPDFTDQFKNFSDLKKQRSLTKNIIYWSTFFIPLAAPSLPLDLN